MKRIPVILLSLVVITLSQIAAAADFEEIHVSGPCEITLKQCPDSAGMVIIAAGQPKVEGLEVRRASEVLFVTLPPNALTDKLLHMRVYYNDNIRLIDAGGRAKIIAPDINSDNALSVISSGAASVCLGGVEAKNVNVSVSGSGKIDFDGSTSASTLNLSLTGSGKIEVDSVAVGHLTVTQRGSGKIILAGLARECAIVGFGSGRVDASRLTCPSLNLKQFSSGQIFYQPGARVVIDGKSSNIHPVNYEKN